MPSITVLKSIILLVISFLAGLGYFYIQSEQSKAIRKKQLEATSSILINIVIYIWLGKVIANLPKFIDDPLAILAYPSNSTAFYIASILGLINIMINVRKKKVLLNTYIIAFIPVFIGASLIFEFVNYINSGTINNLTYFILLVVLVSLQLLMYKKTSIIKLNLIIVLIWAFVKLLYSIIFSYTTIFNYMIHPLYFIIIILITIYYMKMKKGVE